MRIKLYSPQSRHKTNTVHRTRQTSLTNNWRGPNGSRFILAAALGGLPTAVVMFLNNNGVLLVQGSNRVTVSFTSSFLLNLIIAITGEQGSLIKVVSCEGLDTRDLFGGVLAILHQLIYG